MKNNLIIFSFLMLSTIAMAQNQKSFEIFQENNRFGLRGFNQQVIVKPIYEKIKRSPFGLFAVQDKFAKWALFDAEGIQVTEFDFDNIEQQLPKVIELRKGNLIGLFNEKGEVLIPVEYNKIAPIGRVILLNPGNMKPKDFQFRGAIVTKGNRSGFLNQKAEEVLEISYQKIKATADFQLDLGIVEVVGLIVKKNNLYGIVDETGREIFPMKYLYINAINQLGFGEIQENGKKGLYNSKFEIITQPQFDNISVLNQQLFAGQKNGQWFIYNTTKPTETQLNCDAVQPLANSYSKVALNDKIGAIDKNGNLVIPCEYDAISVFGKNLLLTKDKNNYIFTKNKTIEKWNFPELITWFNQAETLKPIRFPNGKIGFINDDAATVIAPKFEQATTFDKTVAIVCNKGKCGFINPTGKFILPMEYELPTLTYQPEYLLAKKGEKYGYLDYQGQTIVSIIYDEISVFQPIMKAKKNGKYGFIDAKEEIIIPFKYDFLENFEPKQNEFRFLDNEKFGWISLKGVERYSVNLSTWADKIYPIENGVQNVKVGKNFGLLDAQNNWIAPMKYDKYIGFDSEGKAIVRANQKWGMIDEKGQIIIPLAYDETLKFNTKGFACIRKNGQFGIVNKNGKIIIPPIYDSYIYSDYEFWTVQKNGQQGLINQDGKLLIPTNYKKVFPFIEGIALVKKSGKWAYINQKNQIVIPFEYDVLNSFIKGKAIAAKGEKWGIIDLGNNVVLPFEFDNLITESNGFISANKNGFWGILDADYQTIIPFEYDKINQINDFFKIEKNGKIGVFTIDGQLILPAYYDALTIEKKIGFKVKKDGRFGLISKSGKVIAPVIYNEMSFFVDGFSRVKKDEKFGMLSQTGELMIPCKYDNLGSRFHGQYVEAKLGEHWGILDYFGKKIVKFKYEKIRFINNKKAEVFLNGVWKVVEL